MMKKMITLILLTSVLCLSLCSCQKDELKTVMAIEKEVPLYTVEDLLNCSDLVIQGTVTEKSADYFTNEDGTKEYAGQKIANSHVSQYQLSVNQVFHGKYTEDTVDFKIYEGYGMSPELYYNGEDDTTVLAEKIIPTELEIGQEYVVFLAEYPMTTAEKFGDDGGYCPAAEKIAIFKKAEDGAYYNLEVNTSPNHLKLNLEALD